MKKRKNRAIDESLPNPPIFTAECSSPQECLDYYKRFQILHYRLLNDQRSSCPLMSTPLKGLQAVWNVNKEIITTQWKVENYCGVYEDSLTAERIIMGSGVAERTHPFYASCVIESRADDENHTDQAVDEDDKENSFAIADTFLDGYIRHPPFAKWNNFRHDDTIWVFLGKNVLSTTSDHSSSSSNMQGRTEHTDFVDHTGAWHFQISGRKIWRCRPVEESPEWGDQGAPAVSECCDYNEGGGTESSRDSSSHNDERQKEFKSHKKIVNEESRSMSQGRSAGDDASPSSFRYLSITCEEGDILMINTRLWWHETCIPSTELAAEKLSMSYARDFYCIAAAPAGGPINHKR